MNATARSISPAPVDVAARPLLRSRARAAGLAALVLWAPTALPLLTGQLGGSGRAGSQYAQVLPIVPGIVAPVALECSGAWFWLAGALATLVAFGTLYAVGREATRGVLHTMQGIAVLVVGVQAMLLAHALHA